jgi:uncharacterized protein YceK
MLKREKKMKRLLLVLLCGILLAGCATVNRSSCPQFPLPSEHVQEVMDKLGEEDREVWAWGNELLDLCQKLGTCEIEEAD